MSTFLLALFAALGLQPEPAAAPSSTLAARLPDLESRLEALTPSDPAAYFEIGEEVAGEAAERQDFALACQLYVLAYELDRGSGASSDLGPSICLAIARIERREDIQNWLRATAGTLDPRYVAADWSVPAASAPTDQTSLRAAEVLGLTRAGDGLKALTAMEAPEVRELLTRFEPLLSDSGLGMSLNRLETQMRQWPCPQCGNKRAVTRVERDGPEIQVCSYCNGNPGPELSQSELVAHLRFESRLLSGLQRSWSAQTASDFGAPLRDPDPDRLAEALRDRYQIPRGRPYRRAGQWSASSDWPAPEPFGPPAPVDAPVHGPPDPDASDRDQSGSAAPVDAAPDG